MLLNSKQVYYRNSGSTFVEGTGNDQHLGFVVTEDSVFDFGHTFAGTSSVHEEQQTH